jgi:hypothetical protein
VLQIKKTLKLKRFDYYGPTPANDNIVRKQLLDNGVEYTG